MKFINPCLLWLAAVASVFAQGVDLSGTFYDKDNRPLPGMVVSLPNLNLSDTTGADGKWLLKVAATSTKESLQKGGLAQWRGDDLQLRLSRSSFVQVEFFDVSGVRLGAVAQLFLEAGSHRLGVPELAKVSTARWARLTVNGKTQVLAHDAESQMVGASSPRVLALVANNIAEPLVYTLQGQLVGVDTLIQLIQSGMDKWIQEFSVGGTVLPDVRVKVDSIFAWVDGGSMAGMRRARIGFNAANNAYSGRLYAVKSLTGEVFQYRVWLNVMGNGNKRVGISDTTSFDSDFGDINFIPIFNVGNAIPAGSIEGPVTGLVNTPYEFHYGLSRLDENIAHQEWNVGEDRGFEPGAPSLNVLWLQPGSYSLQLRLTDVDSNVTTLSQMVNISNQAAVVAGVGDTTITPDDVVAYSITANDIDGVAKVLWDFGDGATDSSFGGPVHQVSHKYPGVAAIAAGSAKTYALVVTVVDKLGNATKQTAQIRVENDVPVVRVNDTVGEVGAMLGLHAQVADRGKIERVEWSLDGVNFSAGGVDTIIQLPAQMDIHYLAFVRVQDEDGNISTTDTIGIKVYAMITDARDGQKYPIVTIGTQTWMAANLNYSGDDGAGNRAYTTGWCYNVGGTYTTQHQDSATCDNGYGRLYRWNDVMGFPELKCNSTTVGASNTECPHTIAAEHQGICPEGWHVPSDAEWTAFTDFVEAKDAVASTAGGWLKAVVEASNTSWNNTSYNQQDPLGFSALPAGYRYNVGDWSSRGNDAKFWSASEDDWSGAWYRYLGYNSASVYRYYDFKHLGYSLRCLQD